MNAGTPPDLGDAEISSAALLPEVNHLYANNRSLPSCLSSIWVRTVALAQTSPIGPPEVVFSETQEVDLPLQQPTEWSVEGFLGGGPRATGDIGVNSSATMADDQDGDGLLDCEELAGGIDVNCDDALVSGEDIIFSELHGVPADPAIPDIYVEVDWADCSESYVAPGTVAYSQCAILDSSGALDLRNFEPPQEVLDRVEAEFARNAHQLHFVKSGPFPATMGFRVNGPTATSVDSVYSLWDTAGDRLHAQRVRSLFFGDPGDTPEVVAAKRTFMRHHQWGYAPNGNRVGGRNGQMQDDIFVVHLDPNEPALFQIAFPPGGQAAGQTADVGQSYWDESYQLWALIVMHELGHSLGLGHGGVKPKLSDPLENEWDDQPYKPNYLSVMNYGYGDVLDGRLSPQGIAMPQLRYNEEERTVNQCVTEPATGTPIPDGGLLGLNPFGHPESFTIQYACPNKLSSTWLGGPHVDWDCDGSGLNATRREFDIMPFVCSQYDWQKLRPLGWAETCSTAPSLRTSTRILRPTLIGWVTMYLPATESFRG